jgi:hypothetical protein
MGDKTHHPSFERLLSVAAGIGVTERADILARRGFLMNESSLLKNGGDKNISAKNNIVFAQTNNTMLLFSQALQLSRKGEKSERNPARHAAASHGPDGTARKHRASHHERREGPRH